MLHGDESGWQFAKIGKNTKYEEHECELQSLHYYRYSTVPYLYIQSKQTSLTEISSTQAAVYIVCGTKVSP